jgi:F0F1-type ATP synthase membrane subunit a
VLRLLFAVKRRNIFSKIKKLFCQGMFNAISFRTAQFGTTTGFSLGMVLIGNIISGAMVINILYSLNFLKLCAQIKLNCARFLLPLHDLHELALLHM